VYRRSAIYLAGCAGLMLVFGYMCGNAGRKNILGADSIFLINQFRSRRGLFGFKDSI